MPGTVLIQSELEIVTIRAWGDVTEKEMLDSRDLALNAFRQRGITRVLVDARDQSSGPSVTELFRFVESWRRDELTKMTIAIVPSQECRQDMRFVETVGLNRGSNVRVFETIADATAWLKS